MGRDKVLGLSLAILLIGFAAAFCFRNEQFVESGLKLARAKILDEAIAQRSGPKPYAPDPKVEREKSTLPTVTLQGIESIEPFADLQTAQAADREKATASKGRKKALAEAVTDRVDVKPSFEEKTPAIGTLTTEADTGSAPLDTDKAALAINASKPATAPATSAVDGSAASSESLSSAEPPASDSSSNENQAPSTNIVIRPNSLLGGRADSLVRQNVAWQSTAGQRDRGPIADNSSRDDSPVDSSALDKSPSEDPPREGSTRDNPSRDNPTRDLSAGDRPMLDNPPRGNVLRDNASRDYPTTGNPTGDADGSPKHVLYRVRRGDTLTKIALHHLGDSSRYREIFAANRDQLRSPDDRLKIGMTLRIPSNTAKPDKASGPVARRKSRSSRSGHVAAGSSRTRKAPIRNVSRVRETPPNATIARPPAAPSDDENMNSDPQPTNRFVPVRKAPFLPASKNETDKQPPPENRDNMAPDMSHYRFFPRSEPVRIAGDREDAYVR